MAGVKHRRMPTKLRIEQHTITIRYLGEKTTTTFTAAQLVPPGELRRYRQSKGRFCLSFKLLIARLNQICGDFNEIKHAVVFDACHVCDCQRGSLYGAVERRGVWSGVAEAWRVVVSGRKW
jgi:hypothetical protein